MMIQNHYRRRAVVFAAVIYLFSLFPITSFAGETELTVHISSVEDLVRMSEDCRLNTGSEGKTYILDEDLDLGNEPFESIPTFSGVFDGQNHKITGFVLAGDGSHQGFFRYIQPEGAVSKLTVEGTVTPDNSRCQIGGIAGVNSGKISGCRFSGTVSGLNYIGGIAGVNYGEITGCSAEGTVSGKRFTGGICGYSEGTVSECVSSAGVNVTISEGGLELNNLNLTNYSDSLSLVSAEDASIVSDTGGIAGYSSGIISNCRNSGNVGYPHYGYNTGGIAGRQSGYTFSCVNNGTVTGRKDVGGICGQMEPDLLLKYTKNIADEIRTLTVLANQALDTISDSTGSVSAALESLRFFADGVLGEFTDITNIYDEIKRSLSLDPESFDPGQAAAALSDLYDFLYAGGMESDAGQLDAILFYIRTAMEDASDLSIEQLRKVADQAGVVMELFSSALAGDINTRVYDDVSEAMEDGSMDGRVERCRNNGSVSGDSNVGGISGAMAIEYEFDMEGSILSAVDDAIGTGSVTSGTFKSRCVCIANVNNGMITGKKDCIGGINGLQDCGFITGCENYGNATSTDGGYVGGISGESCSVADCCALCDLYGQEYVGGISGLAEKIMNCSSIVKMDDVTACYGAIAGYLNNVDSEHLAGNTFVGERLGAVDGISYSGLAEPVEYTEYLNNDSLPELFRSMKLVFRADDTVVAEVPFRYGDSVAEEEIPAVPEKEGFTGKWPDFDRTDLTGSAVIDAVYTARLSAVESAEKREEPALPVIIAEGDFTTGTVLSLKTVTESLPDEPGTEILEAWTVGLSGTYGENVSRIRYQMPEMTEPAVNTFRILALKDGKWTPLEFETKGSYSVFDMEGNPMTFCAVQTENTARMYVIYGAGCAGGIILLLLVFRAVRGRGNGKKKQNGMQTL